MFISVQKTYKTIGTLLLLAIAGSLFLFARKQYQAVNFGDSFGYKSTAAKTKLCELQAGFETCSEVCFEEPKFMQAIVFPEVMRYNCLKDGIEAESLRTLYVQFGKEYANFSIGFFQMKPSFAEAVEEKVTLLLSNDIKKELQLGYASSNNEIIRRERVERLQDTDWQLIYLTAFVCLCHELYKDKHFINNLEKLQWYATIYNAGFDRSDGYILQKIKDANFYLEQEMPGKKFRYAAICSWFYQSEISCF